MANVCTVRRNPRVVKEFVATVTIPIGFKVIGNGDDPRYPYTDYISIDRSALQVSMIEELYPSIIQVPDCQDPTKTQELPCESKVRTIKLTGPLNYSAIISGFMPVIPVEATPQTPDVTVTTPTAFNDSKMVEISCNLGYSCYECDFPDDFIQGFKVEIIQNDEFLVNHSGNIIFHHAEAPEDFMRELNGLNTVIINIPFVLTLTPTEPTTI